MRRRTHVIQPLRGAQGWSVHMTNFGTSRARTLIEVLEVVVVLAILTAVAMPLYLSTVVRSPRQAWGPNPRTVTAARQASRVNVPPASHPR